MPTLNQVVKGTIGQLVFGLAKGLGQSPGLFWDNVNNVLGIGTSTPSASAVLDLTSTTQGFAPPRMSNGQMNAIVLPATGLEVFNISGLSPFVNTGTPAAPNWLRVNISASGFGAYSSITTTTPVTVAAAPGNVLLATLTQGAAGSYAAIFNGAAAVRPALVSTQNNADLNTLISQLQALPAQFTHAATFGAGETITAGTYDISSAASGSGALTLNAAGNANAVFVFRVNGAFSTVANATMTLSNGAQACNVFWLCTGAPSLGATSTAVGTFISITSTVSAATGAVLNGRFLSKAGAITSTNATLTAPATVSSSINVGNLQNFVAYTLTGAVSNTGTMAGSGDIGSGLGAVGAGYSPVIGNMYSPSMGNTRATFAVYIAGVLIPGTQCVVESQTFGALPVPVGALAVMTAGQAVEVRVKVDCGTFVMTNSFFSADRKG